MLSTQETTRLWRWEYTMLLKLGFEETSALELANGGVSWHDAADLIRAGCPHDAAQRILSRVPIDNTCV